MKVANEMFAIIPVEEVIINAVDDILNPKTGHIDKQTILSVRFMKKTLLTMNLEQIDPSESMNNFLHNMKF